MDAEPPAPDQTPAPVPDPPPAKKTGRGRGKPVGRRSKLDDVMVSRICGQIKKGNTIRTAVVACGIHQATFYEWKAQGEDDRAAKKTTKFTRFLDDVEHADAVAQQRLLAGVLHKAPWKAQLEILKRRWPKEFGDKTALTNPDGTALAGGFGGGPPINVNIRCNAPDGDDPFVIDESALPPKPDEPSDAAKAVATLMAPP